MYSSTNGGETQGQRKKMIQHNTISTKINNDVTFVASLTNKNIIQLTTWSYDVGFSACDMTLEQAKAFAKKLLELAEHKHTEPEQIVLNAYKTNF
jgi:hypothetical protein